jgi:hypothetical protein
MTSTIPPQIADYSMKYEMVLSMLDPITEKDTELSKSIITAVENNINDILLVNVSITNLQSTPLTEFKNLVNLKIYPSYVILFDKNTSMIVVIKTNPASANTSNTPLDTTTLTSPSPDSCSVVYASTNAPTIVCTSTGFYTTTSSNLLPLWIILGIVGFLLLVVAIFYARNKYISSIAKNTSSNI